MHHKKRDNGTGLKREKEMGMQVLKEAFNGMLDAMAVADGEGNIIFWNKAAEKMFGYSKKEAIGKNVHQLLAPVKYREDAKRGMEIFGEMGTGPAIDANLELCAIRKGGEEFPMELSLSKFQTPEGPRVVGVMRDISERKRREREAAQMQEKLLRLEVSESLGEIVSGIIHEFNNLLTSTMGFAELLIVVRENHPDRKKYAQMIVRATERATKLAGTLLRMIKGNNEISPICMNDIVDETCGLLLPQAQKNNVIVCKKLQPVAFVMGNYVQLGSILMNMFINSMHAMEGCEVKELTISTEDILISGDDEEMSDGPYVLLKISDTGCGIPPEIGKKIFENFFTTKKNGNGIGLTMAMNFVKKHKGYLKLFSEVGKGTKFEIYLPSFSASQIV